MTPRRKLHEIRPVLQALTVTNAIIIGGQAVNLWAERYHKECLPWQELLPYTSFDLDVLGSRLDVLSCSESLNAAPILPLPGENTVNAGKVITRIGSWDFEIDFLHSPNGLAPAEVAELARVVTFEGIELRVLHPIHCVESKTVNLATLPQDSGERQDLKHLRLSIAILREYLSELTLEGSHEQVLLRWASRIRSNSNHELGLQAAIKHGINFQEAIPKELWKQHPGPLADFVSCDCPKWKDQISEKISESQELESWLESLRSKPPPPNQN